MKRILGNQGIFGLIYCLFGIVLLIRPMAIGKVVCYVLGVCALGYGLWKIYGYWKVKDLAGFYKGELAVGVILVVMGLVALIKPSLIISILPAVVGLMILMDGLVTISQALSLRKLDYRWSYLLALGISISVLGLILVANPFGSAMIMMRFLGATLLVDGACELWRHYKLMKIFEG